MNKEELMEMLELLIVPGAVPEWNEALAIAVGYASKLEVRRDYTAVFNAWKDAI